MSFASFFAGIACATFAASGVFFLKFWKASRDPFFLYFSVACWLLSIERISTVMLGCATDLPRSQCESGVWVYLIRLCAFILIFIGILRKNRARR